MRRAALLATLALVVGTTQGGCSFVAWSFASHNSRGNGCIDDPTFSVIDIVGSSVGAVALVYTGVAEESPGWLVIPGVFFLSGVIGAASVYACRHPDPDEQQGVAKQGKPTPYTYEDQPPDNVIPQENREPVEPALRDATLEERGMSVPVYTPPPAVEHTPPPQESETKIACRINPLTNCGPGYSCVLTDGDHGFCRKDSDAPSKPKTTLPP